MSRQASPSPSASAGRRRRWAIPLVLAVAAVLSAFAVVMIFLGNQGPEQLSGVAGEINDVPSGQIAVAPDSETLFVVDARTADLHVVDVGDPLHGGPCWVTAWDRDRPLARRTDRGRHPLGDDSLSFVDTELGEVVGTVSVRRPLDVAVSADGNRAYVTSSETDTVQVIDTNDLTLLGTIRLNDPVQIVLARDGKRGYVVSPQANALAELDTESQTVLRKIPLDRPGRIAITADGQTAYVTSPVNGLVHVVDLKAGEAVGTIPVGGDAAGAVLAPDDKTLYVANRAEGAVAVIDTESRAVVRTLAAGNTGLIWMSPDTKRFRR